MSELQSIDLFVFGNKITLSSDKPDEVRKLAIELDEKTNFLAEKFPGAPTDIVLTIACLQALEEVNKLKNELLEFSTERDKLDTAIQGFLYSLD